MDVNRLSTGEKLAGAAGIALLLIMFIFNWFDYGGAGLSAWDSMELIRFILLLAALSGIALAVVKASQSNVDLPVALSAITAGLGILAVVLVIFRIISPPDFGLGDFAEAAGGELDVGRGIGVFLGLIAAAGVAAGGWLAMQEEGTSFGAQTDRAGGDGPRDSGGPGRRDSGGPGASPPPPPPPSGTSGTSGTTGGPPA